MTENGGLEFPYPFSAFYGLQEDNIHRVRTDDLSIVLYLRTGSTWLQAKAERLTVGRIFRPYPRG